MKQNLFREAPIERLSSPEQLDELIKITSPKAWLGLVGIFAILATVVVWSFWGSIPTKVDGSGILLSNGGVYPIIHNTSGEVIDVKVRIGDTVRKGDVVARIEVPELVSAIHDLLSQLEEMSSNSDSEEYQALTEHINLLREEMVYRSQVISPVSGRILELNVFTGLQIDSGQPLMLLEQQGEGIMMEAVVYVPIEQSGLIRPGMDVQISPTSVHREEHGYLLGTVAFVSDYPERPESMMQTLENEYLVSLFSKQNAPIMIKVHLIPDVRSASGYRWSRPGDPPAVVHSGTFVHSSIITKRERPINKVLPLPASGKQ